MIQVKATSFFKTLENHVGDEVHRLTLQVMVSFRDLKKVYCFYVLIFDNV